MVEDEDGRPLEDLYLQLTRKPIFECGFKDHYKARQKKIGTDQYSYLVGVLLQTNR